MNTPKKLNDLRYEDNVLHLTNNQTVDTEARRWFKEVLGSTLEPKINKLFTEDDKAVYESYVDSGSVDYLYLVK